MQERRKKYTAVMNEKMIEKGLLTKQPQVTYGLIFGSESFIKEIITKYASHKYYKDRKTYTVDQETSCLRKFKT